MILDYSRQRVTGETMEMLFDLADSVGFAERREAMRTGRRINVTQDLPVLHHVLRVPNDFPLRLLEVPGGLTTNSEVMDEIIKSREKVKLFSEQIRSGAIRSLAKEPFKATLVIGIGGHSLGTRYVHDGLRSDHLASHRATGRQLRFISNVDPTDFERQTVDLNARETLVIVVSKSFTETETMLNARTVREWMFKKLVKEGSEEEMMASHFFAITANVDECVQFGIARENIFTLPPWLSPRFSVYSTVGMLPLSIQYSFGVMKEFLNGAHDIDQHFFHTPLRDNIPTILGLLDVWNTTFLNFNARAILPYSEALRSLPALVQDVSMTSNGKRVSADGRSLHHKAGELIFGEPGTNSESTFHQLLHQGRTVPSEFIGFMFSQVPIEVPGEAASNHDELMSHFFAQPDALAYGKTLPDLIQEGAPENLREHLVLTGNRPSSSLLFRQADAFTLGQILALYEHRTVTQGFVWGINSFDMNGTELGKVLARSVRAQLSASRKTGASVQGFNSSTSALLEQYLAPESS